MKYSGVRLTMGAMAGCFLKRFFSRKCAARRGLLVPAERVFEFLQDNAVIKIAWPDVLRSILQSR